MLMIVRIQCGVQVNLIILQNGRCGKVMWQLTLQKNNSVREYLSTMHLVLNYQNNHICLPNSGNISRIFNFQKIFFADAVNVTPNVHNYMKISVC